MNEYFEQVISDYLQQVSNRVGISEAFDENAKISEVTICIGKHHSVDDFRDAFNHVTDGSAFEDTSLNLKQYVGGRDPFANGITLEGAKVISPPKGLLAWLRRSTEEALSF